MMMRSEYFLVKKPGRAIQQLLEAFSRIKREFDNMRLHLVEASVISCQWGISNMLEHQRSGAVCLLHTYHFGIATSP